MDIPEKGRQAAHVLLDAVVANGNGPDDDNSEAVNLAYQLLVERELFSVAVEEGEEEDELSIEIDLSDLLGASFVTLRWLIEELASARGASPEEIVVAAREFLDS